MNNFHYSMALMDNLYGITLPEDAFEELALNAWNLIGNKRYRLYRYSACIDQDNKIELPCNADVVEAVTALLENNQVGVFNVANDGAYTIKQLSEAIGYKWNKEQVVTQAELHKSQGLYLVNNVLDLSKLKQFYTSRDAIEEFKWCKEHLHE